MYRIGAQRSLRVLIAAALFASGCSGASTEPSVDDSITTATTAPVADDPAADTAEAPQDEPETTAAAGDRPTIDVTAEASERSVLAASVTIESSIPVRARIVATSGDHEVTTPFTAATSMTHVLPLVGLRAEREYTVAVTAEGAGEIELVSDATSFSTGALPDFIPEYAFTADPTRTADGVTLIEVIPFDADRPVPASVIAVDDGGQVVWYYQWSATLGGIKQSPTGTFVGHNYPFSLVEFDVLGDTLARWQVETDDSAGSDDPSVDNPVLDEDSLSSLVAALTGLPGDPDPVFVSADWMQLGAFHHESHYLDNGNLLFLTTTVHELEPAQRAALCPGDPLEFNVISDVAVEMTPAGEVVRTWDLWDVLDVDLTPGSDLCLSDGIYADGLERDWTHANSVIYDSVRDALIISSRHTDQIVAIEYGTGVGPQSELRWILGAAATMPLDGQPPFHSHAVDVLDDGSIIAYDNGNGRPGTLPDDPTNPTFSRAVIYDIDDTAADRAEWSATQVWEHRVDDIDGTSLYAFFVGDADQLDNGNVLIDHGGIGSSFDTTSGARIIEVVPEGVAGGEIVMDFRMGSIDDPVISYRAERIESLFVGPLWQQ